MAKIDFVPNDYIQQKECGRANFLYLILFGILMGAIGVTFSIIKMRQKAVESDLSSLEQRMAEAGAQIAQLDELKKKTSTMMQTMVTTAELLEPMPRSVILACLTNKLPGGVSLLELKMEEKEQKAASSRPPSSQSQYQKTKAQQEQTPQSANSRPATETTIEIKGIAPSDIEVASYIARLSASILMQNVALVESKEHIVEDVRYREFKLKAKLKQNISLTKEDIEKIRRSREIDT
ncbi:MAG: PilN domain-containing protein [Sedimentisphaerales bacterium]|nr:PilN domain-containing protein [Sedimentisphaerales bacterium]